MRNLCLAAAAVSLMLTAAIPLNAAQAAPEGRLIVGVDHVGDRPSLEPVQYIYGGRNYCWYDGGWRGGDHRDGDHRGGDRHY